MTELMRRIGPARSLLAVVAAVILGAAVAAAARQGSFDPISEIGWLPAVLVAGWSRPAARRPCWPRLRGRAGS